MLIALKGIDKWRLPRGRGEEGNKNADFVWLSRHNWDEKERGGMKIGVTSFMDIPLVHDEFYKWYTWKREKLQFHGYAQKYYCISLKGNDTNKFFNLGIDRMWYRIPFYAK